MPGDEEIPVKKVITPELSEAIKKKIELMKEIEYEEGQEIDLSDLAGEQAGWYIAYKT